MLLNALKVAFRNLLRNKVYSLINIIGLAIGIACCLLILVHVMDEFSYDGYHAKKDNIYRMALERMYPDHNTHYAMIPATMGEAAKDEFPEIQEMVRLWAAFGDVIFQYEDDIYEESHVMFADSSFFDVFSIPLKEGNPQTALAKPNSLILTQETAKRYFGDEPAMGKTLKTNFGDFLITGVCGDVPQNSHFDFEFLGSINSLNFIVDNKEYMSFSTRTYLLLKDGTNPAALEAKFPGMVEKYASGQVQRRLGVSYKEYTDAGNGYRYYLQPLTSIHLHSQLSGEFKANGNITYVYLFLSIGIFILLIACINFMNLATARSSERAREVGIRKVLGSLRQQLITQFLVESILIASISMILAIVAMRFTLPLFNEIAGKNLDFDFAAAWWIVPSLIGVVLLVGLMAGSYPAFVLSNFKPVLVLKGAFKSTKQGTLLRNGLVVFQFGISIFLIASTMIIYQQMEFTRNKNLGFNKDHVVVVERANALNDKIETFKDEVKNLAGVVNTSSANALPGGYYYGFMVQTQTNGEVVTGHGMNVDDDFIESLDFELVTGRDFDEKFNDSLSVILNETMVRNLGMTDPIGKQIINPGNTPEQTNTFTVIGVVKDFHYESLHKEIGSLAIMHNNGPNGFQAFIPIKVNAENMSETITQIEEKWNTFSPQTPFSYHFLDEEIAEMYRNEQSSGQLFGAFAILAILIACIGLFGLATFTAQQRTKEIGVRKVLGATVGQLMILLSKEITLLVLFAFALAVPVVWFVMDKWLEDFVYKISIGFGVFVLAGGIALMIALLTVSYNSFRTASINPVKALRDE